MTQEPGASDDAPGWLRELPLTPGPPWVTMGVRGLDGAAWLVVDGDLDAQLALKARSDGDVFRSTPGTEAAGAEVLALVEGWIDEHGPSEARRVLADARATGAGADHHPLLRAALLVQEDLCLMTPGGGLEADGSGAAPSGYVLTAAAVHFPSHWRLADKMGLAMARIHAPVRHYDVELAARADRFFERLAEGRIMVRRNVSIHDHDDLYRPEPPETYEDFAGDFSTLWLRSERQTLRRLTASDDVLFTIKTQQCPLPVVRHLPEVALGLAAKLRAIRHDHEAAGLPVHAPLGIDAYLEAAPAAG